MDEKLRTSGVQVIGDIAWGHTFLPVLPDAGRTGECSMSLFESRTGR